MNREITAIRVASEAHNGQKRKGKDLPYIVHPLAVGLLLSRVQTDEDVVIAGIMHDTIEDTDITYEDIEKQFGKTVADMVNDVSEQDKSLPWAERKQRALEHIKEMPHGSLLVKAADVLHNMTDTYEDYLGKGDAMFASFNASKEMQLTRYGKLIDELKKTWPENPLLPDLERTYKAFLSVSRNEK